MYDMQPSLKYHLCLVQQARSATQIVILTLSFLIFCFTFFVALFWRAGRQLCEHAGRAGPGVP